MGGSITEVAGILVGHAHDAVRGSGVTVLLFPGGAMAVAAPTFLYVLPPMGS